MSLDLQGVLMVLGILLFGTGVCLGVCAVRTYRHDDIKTVRAELAGRYTKGGRTRPMPMPLGPMGAASIARAQFDIGFGGDGAAPTAARTDQSLTVTISGDTSFSSEATTPAGLTGRSSNSLWMQVNAADVVETVAEEAVRTPVQVRYLHGEETVVPAEGDQPCRPQDS